MIVAYSIANQNGQAILNDIDFTHTFTVPANPYDPLEDGTYSCTLAGIKGLLKSVNPSMRLFRAVLIDKGTDATDSVDDFLSGKLDTPSGITEIKKVIADSESVNRVIEGAI